MASWTDMTSQDLGSRFLALVASYQGCTGFPSISAARWPHLFPWPSAPAGWNAAPALFHWLFSQDPGGKSKIPGTQLTSFSSYLQVFSRQIKMPESSGSFVRPLPFETTGGQTRLSGPKPGSKCLGSL